MDTVRDITLDDLLAANDLIEQHRKATSSLPVKPDEPSFRALEATGMLRILGFFTAADEMVGYAVLVLAPHPMHGEMWCTCIALFVEETARQLGGCAALLKHSEDIARAADAKFIMWTVRNGSPLEQILPRKGAELVDRSFVKEL